MAKITVIVSAPNEDNDDQPMEDRNYFLSCIRLGLFSTENGAAGTSENLQSSLTHVRPSSKFRPGSQLACKRERIGALKGPLLFNKRYPIQVGLVLWVSAVVRTVGAVKDH
ncbi:hypothetical protein RvY_16904 [Ramazzottius varieornatus]|uniref:Uncharacterized protein n=1 Tax=Ramazzottius varieornatus TaxID=947166 RepID=A0A1D1W6D2_RAMVA|nr:hypothetical protein RvY_16904 [Ramazzottius varieornatus]